MNRFFLVPALGVATLAFSAQAHAQQLGTIADSTHPAYAADARQPYYESRRAAYDNGYREGLTEGERDGRRGQARPYQDNRTWQRADKGYNRSYGERRALPPAVPRRLLGRLPGGRTSRYGGIGPRAARCRVRTLTAIRAATATATRFSVPRSVLPRTGPLRQRRATATARPIRTA